MNIDKKHYVQLARGVKYRCAMLHEMLDSSEGCGPLQDYWRAVLTATIAAQAALMQAHLQDLAEPPPLNRDEEQS